MKKDYSFSALVRFFKRPDLSQHCPVCNSSKWNILTPGEPDQATGLVHILPLFSMDFETEEVSPLPESGHVVLCSQCKNCGFMRMHRMDVVTQWLKDNPEDAKSEEAAASEAPVPAKNIGGNDETPS